jgi:hypothetical protein
LETAKALAKYGLKYDETRKEIFKAVSTDTIRPSLDPEVSIYSEKGIVLDSISDNICKFKISLANQIAPAKKAKLYLYFLAQKENYIELRDLKPYRIYGYGNDMNFDGSSTSQIDVKYDNATNIFFYLKGTFENTKGKVFNVQRIYSYDMTRKTFGAPNEPKYSIIMDLLKKNKLYDESLK